MASGRTFEQVDEMTLDDVQIIFDYWNRSPPANEILASVYRVKPSPRRMTVDQVRDMKPPPGCLSIEELKALAGKIGLPT